MAYNTSKASVRRIKRHIDDMIVAARTITWPAKEPRKFAYHIREAIFAARHHPEYEKYAALRVDYKIYSHRGYVEARYQGTPIDEVVTVTAPERMTITEITDAPGIVGAAIKFEPRTDEIYFPNAVLNDDEKLSVWRWGRMEGWALIDQEDEGVTLTRREVEKIFLWQPPRHKLSKVERADLGDEEEE